MAALSVAVDLGLGETVEHAQRSAVISVALSEAAGLTEEQAQDAYYLSLLQTVGCTGDHDFAFRSFGEDMGDWIPLAVMGAPMEMMGSMVRNVGRGQAALKRARTPGPGVRRACPGSCATPRSTARWGRCCRNGWGWGRGWWPAWGRCSSAGMGRGRPTGCGARHWPCPCACRSWRATSSSAPASWAWRGRWA